MSNYGISKQLMAGVKESGHGQFQTLSWHYARWIEENHKNSQVCRDSTSEPPKYKGIMLNSVAYPGILFGGGSTNSVEDRGQRERGSGGSSPLVRGCGGSCNLVQDISFHIVKFS